MQRTATCCNKTCQKGKDKKSGNKYSRLGARCNTLQRTARCNTLQQGLSKGQGQKEWRQVIRDRSLLQHAAARCHTLHHTLYKGQGQKEWQRVIRIKNTLQHAATRPLKGASAKRVSTINPR